VVATKVRLVRPDAGEALIHAAKYKAPRAGSACGIMSRKSGKPGEDPTLWNIHNGHLCQDYQFSREVSQVSRTDI
jgi:hypothetical protein